MPESLPKSPAPAVPSISDEQWPRQSLEQNGFMVSLDTIDRQDSCDESDNTDSVASVHSEYSDELQSQEVECE
ncbi:hypothetical protein GcC1_103027 [Golovinomyces cichoracearum]|uniref:Uncharacterized protein n=1 Tax=Golovinomyces cichoracearum TaxID=62708 RepID=A0A420I9N8_9PEZI|nr:hypothetical protein GcC1_103027 [Golovinomyces cichoracearum]